MKVALQTYIFYTAWVISLELSGGLINCGLQAIFHLSLYWTKRTKLLLSHKYLHPECGFHVCHRGKNLLNCHELCCYVYLYSRFPPHTPPPSVTSVYPNTQLPTHVVLIRVWRHQGCLLFPTYKCLLDNELHTLPSPLLQDPVTSLFSSLALPVTPDQHSSHP